MCVYWGSFFDTCIVSWIHNNSTIQSSFTTLVITIYFTCSNLLSSFKIWQSLILWLLQLCPSRMYFNWNHLVHSLVMRFPWGMGHFYEEFGIFHNDYSSPLPSWAIRGSFWNFTIKLRWGFCRQNPRKCAPFPRLLFPWVSHSHARVQTGFRSWSNWSLKNCNQFIMAPIASAPEFRVTICPVMSVICWVQE